MERLHQLANETLQSVLKDEREFNKVATSVTLFALFALGTMTTRANRSTFIFSASFLLLFRAGDLTPLLAFIWFKPFRLGVFVVMAYLYSVYLKYQGSTIPTSWIAAWCFLSFALAHLQMFVSLVFDRIRTPSLEAVEQRLEALCEWYSFPGTRNYRRQLEKKFNEPLFRKSITDLPIQQQREIQYERLLSLIQAGLIGVEYLDEAAGKFFACHEYVLMCDADLTYLLSVHFNLYSGSLLRLSTKKHAGILEAANSGKSLGCFALTEAAEGVMSGLFNNTTAIYDKEKKAFIINTPTDSFDPAQDAAASAADSKSDNAVRQRKKSSSQASDIVVAAAANGQQKKPVECSFIDLESVHGERTKFRKNWITNGGYYAENVVVFANLIVEDSAKKTKKDLGIHAFLVPLREKRGGQALKGITVQDIGEKTCLRAVDNASISFNNVEVPLDALLDRHASVDEQGNYKSSIQDHPRQQQLQFELVANQLLSGRICISSAAIHAAEICIDLCIRHMQSRLQKISPKGDTLPLFEHASISQPLLGFLASSYVYRAFIRLVQAEYSESKTKCEPELIFHACIAKAVFSTFSSNVIPFCQRKSGGIGLLARFKMGTLHNSFYSSMLVEGDSVVLMQKVARDKLRSASKRGMLRMLAQGAALFAKTEMFGTFHIDDTDWLFNLFKQREFSLLYFVAQRMASERKANLVKCWTTEIERKVLDLGHAVSDVEILKCFREKLRTVRNNRPIHQLMSTVYHLHMLLMIEKNIGSFLMATSLCASHVPQINNTIVKLIKKIKPFVNVLLDAMELPRSLA